MAGLNLDRVLQALRLVEGADAARLHRVRDYDVPNVSEKVVRIIHSYVDYIHRTVWQRNEGAAAVPEYQSMRILYLTNGLIRSRCTRA